MTPALSQVIKIYQSTSPDERESKIEEALSDPLVCKAFTVWLDTHQNRIEKNPFLRDLQSRIQILKSSSLSGKSQGKSLTLYQQAVKYVKHSIDILSPSTAKKLETLIFAKNLSELMKHFSSYPDDVFEHADLLKTHIELNTLSIKELLLILKTTSPHIITLQNAETGGEPFLPSTPFPSLLQEFSEEIMQAIETVSDEGELIVIRENLKALINQDAISSNPNSQLVAKIQSITTPLEKLTGIALITTLPMNLLKKELSKKDAVEDTPLHDPNILQALTPLLLEKISTQDLIKLLTLKNKKGCLVLENLDFARLSKLETHRLIAILYQIEKIIPVLNLSSFKNKLPPFVDHYQKIFNHHQDPSTMIQSIQDLEGLSQTEKDAILAHYIEHYQKPLILFEGILSREQFLSLGSHLRYVDLRNFNNIILAQELVENCPNLNQLFISNGIIIQNVQELSLCQTFNCRFCTLKKLPRLPLCQTLECNNCHLLEELPHLPLCQTLNCSNCHLLERLSKLPLCQILNCSHCYQLKELPKLQLCQILNCSNCHLLEGLSELPLCQILDCSSCEQLKKIQALPLCKTLNCSYCHLLKKIPELPVCQTLNCSNCERLKMLSQLPLCQTLDCGNCQLKELPELPLCQILNCSSCYLLQELPWLPLCRILNCNNCHLLKELPELPLCETLNCSYCHLLKKIPELSSCQVLDCSYCEQLKKIQALPLCQTLNCSNCRLLKELPELSSCQALDCSYCEQLKKIQALPLCQTIKCWNCPSLIIFSNLSVLKELSKSNLISLKTLLSEMVSQGKILLHFPSIFMSALPALKELGATHPQLLKELLMIKKDQSEILWHTPKIFKETLPLLELLKREDLLELFQMRNKQGLTMLHEPENLKLAESFIQRYQFDYNIFISASGLSIRDTNAKLNETWLSLNKYDLEFTKPISDAEFAARSQAVKQELLKLWQDLSFESKLNAKETGTVSLLLLEVNKKIYTKDQIRGFLEKMLNKLVKRTPWTGTPPSDDVEGVFNFYRELLIQFEIINKTLRELKEPTLTTGLLVSVASPEIEGRCGSAYIEELDQKVEVITPPPSDMAMKIRFEKAMNQVLRKSIEDLVAKQFDSNVHIVKQFKYVCGLVPTPDHLCSMSIQEIQAMIQEQFQVMLLLKHLRGNYPQELAELTIAEEMPETFQPRLLRLTLDFQEKEHLLSLQMHQLLENKVAPEKMNPLIKQLQTTRIPSLKLSETEIQGLSSGNKATLLRHLFQRASEINFNFPQDLSTFTQKDWESLKEKISEEINHRLREEFPLATRANMTTKQAQIFHQRARDLNALLIGLDGSVRAILKFDEGANHLKLKDKERLAALQARLNFEQGLEQLATTLPQDEDSFILYQANTHILPSRAVMAVRRKAFIEQTIGGNASHDKLLMYLLKKYKFLNPLDC